MVKINNFLPHFCRIIYWKCPTEKPGDGISETLHFKIFRGSVPPDPPSCRRLRRLRKIYFRAYIFKIARYAPVTTFHREATLKTALELLDYSVNNNTRVYQIHKKGGVANRFLTARRHFWTPWSERTHCMENGQSVFFLSPHTPVGCVRLARFARVRLLRYALPISLLILRKIPTVLQSNGNYTRHFDYLGWWIVFLYFPVYIYRHSTSSL